jgi:hypothetical protein
VHEVSANADPSARLRWGTIVAVAVILVVSHALVVFAPPDSSRQATGAGQMD